MANWGRNYTLNTKTGQVISANEFPRSLEHHGNHAVVLFPGAAAAKKGDEEDDNTDRDDNDGDSGGRRVLDLVGVVKSNLNQDANNNQGKAAQLQENTKRRLVCFSGWKHSPEPWK